MQKKQFVVSQVKKDKEMMGISVDNKFLPWEKKSRSLRVSDPGIAKDIRQTIGQEGTKDVIISEVPVMNRDKIHKYTFTVKKPELEKNKGSKYEWVEVSPGKLKMVRKEA